MYSKGSQNICTAWRKALRVVWNIPYMSHKNIVYSLSDCLPIDYALKKRFFKFYQGCINSKSNVVKGVTKMARMNPFSTCCINYVEIIREFQITYDMSSTVFDQRWRDNVDDELLGNTGVVKELISVRDGFKECDIFSIDLVNKVIEDVCVN